MNKPLDARQLSTRINEGILALGLQPDSFPVSTCIKYLGLLGKWNKTYNLTAIENPERMVTHHVLDSLSVLPYLKGNRCIDIGTGAGFPGLILALAEPDNEWILLDSNSKKIRFINQVRLELEIKNIIAVKSRTEDYRPDHLFSTVVTRAYGNLRLIWTHAHHLLAPNGSMLAMKSSLSKQEMSGINTCNCRVMVHPLKVPGITEERTLVEINALPPTE